MSVRRFGHTLRQRGKALEGGELQKDLLFEDICLSNREKCRACSRGFELGQRLTYCFVWQPPLPSARPILRSSLLFWWSSLPSPPIESVERLESWAIEVEGGGSAGGREVGRAAMAMAIGSFGAIVLAEAFKLHLAVDRPLLPLSRFVPPRPYPTPSHSPLLSLRSFGRSSQFRLAFRRRGEACRISCVESRKQVRTTLTASLMRAYQIS